MLEDKTMDKEQIEQLAKEAKEAVAQEARGIEALIKAAGGAVILNVSKFGIKWSFDGNRGRGTASGVRAMLKVARSGDRWTPPEIFVKVSPQAQGNFYPHNMSVAEFKAAVGGGEKFDAMFVEAVKAGIEQSKASAAVAADALAEFRTRHGGLSPNDFIV